MASATPATALQKVKYLLQEGFTVILAQPVENKCLKILYVAPTRLVTELHIYHPSELPAIHQLLLEHPVSK